MTQPKTSEQKRGKPMKTVHKDFSAELKLTTKTAATFGFCRKADPRATFKGFSIFVITLKENDDKADNFDYIVQEYFVLCF